MEQTTAPFRMDELVKEAKVEAKPKPPAAPQLLTVIDDLKSEQSRLQT